MDRNFNRAVTATLKYEGGYVNHPSDLGGATNLGVTIATFRRYVKPNGTIVLECDGDLSQMIIEAGGAETTLYVKESGAGNTGWVEK